MNVQSWYFLLENLLQSDIVPFVFYNGETVTLLWVC